MKTFLKFGVIAALSALLPSTSSAADGYSIKSGKTVQIDEHSVCRNVKNNASTTMHIPTRNASEWSVGTSAFLGASRDFTVVDMCIESQFRMPKGITTTSSLSKQDGVIVSYWVDLDLWPEGFTMNDENIYTFSDITGDGVVRDVLKNSLPKKFTYGGKTRMKFDTDERFDQIYFPQIPVGEIWRITKWSKELVDGKWQYVAKNKHIKHKLSVNASLTEATVRDQIWARRRLEQFHWDPFANPVEGRVDGKGYWFLGGTAAFGGGTNVQDYDMLTYGLHPDDMSAIRWIDFDGLADAWSFDIGTCDSRRKSQSIPKFIRDLKAPMAQMKFCGNLPLRINEAHSRWLTHDDDPRTFLLSKTPGDQLNLRLTGAVFAGSVESNYYSGNKMWDYYTWGNSGEYIVVEQGTPVRLD